MGDTILHYASFKKNRDLISYLLKEGALVTIKNSVSFFNLFGHTSSGEYSYF